IGNFPEPEEPAHASRKPMLLAMHLVFNRSEYLTGYFSRSNCKLAQSLNQIMLLAQRVVRQQFLDCKRNLSPWLAAAGTRHTVHRRLPSLIPPMVPMTPMTLEALIEVARGRMSEDPALTVAPAP